MSITKVTSSMIDSVEATKVTNLPYFDDNDIVNDLSTLALRQASNENKAAYSTSSMYVDVFQDSTGITGLTDAARDSSEFMRAFGSTTVPYSGATDIASASTFGLIQITNEGPPVIGGHTGSYNGDSIMTENVSTHNGATINRGFSTAGDFKIRIYALDSGGNLQGISYPAYGGLFIPDDTYARTNNSSDLFKVPGAGTLNSNGMPFPNSTQWQNLVLNSTYSTNLSPGVASYLGFSAAHTSHGATRQDFDCAGNGFQVNGYLNSGSTNNYGLYAHYTASNNTLFTGVLNNNNDSTFSTTHATASCQVTSIPNNGTFCFIGGDANGSVNQSNGLRKYSLTHTGSAGSLNDCSYDTYPAGTTVTEALVAAGSFESNVITASSAITSMGAIITYQDFSGTNALNTDIIMKLSADGGVTYSNATLVAMPDFSSGIKMAKVNDLTVTSGTALKYKVEFANQAEGSKEARIRGISLQY